MKAAFLERKKHISLTKPNLERFFPCLNFHLRFELSKRGKKLPFVQLCKAFKIAIYISVSQPFIVIIKVLYGLVLFLLQVQFWVCLKVKQRQRINSQRSPGSVNCNVNHQPKYTSVLHSLTLWKVSTNLRYFFCSWHTFLVK